MEQISDLSGLPDNARAELKQRIDGLGGSRLTFGNLKLPGGCTPGRESLSFFKEGAYYCMTLDLPIHYVGEQQAMRRLSRGTPVVFRDYSAMLDFFQSFQPETATSQNPSPANSVTKTEDGYNLDRIADVGKIRIPQRKAQSAPDYKTLRQELARTVFGQEQAVDTIAYQVALHLGKKRPKRPLSIMIYGPSGSGKTELSKAVVKACSEFGSNKNAEVFTDLNQFNEAHSVYRLTGSPPGYVGYDDEPIFAAVTKNPHTIFIFDELDKAHPEVLKTLMAILDEGRCSSRKELADHSREYDFRHCIFIFTSNYRLGQSPRKRIGFDFENIQSTSDATIVTYKADSAKNDSSASIAQRIYQNNERARKAFVEAGVLREIASRFNCFVEFQELSDQARVRIIAKQVIEVGFEYNIRLTYISASILQALVNSSVSGDALTVRSFRSLIDGYLAPAFAAASMSNNQSMRLEGTLEAPLLMPVWQK